MKRLIILLIITLLMKTISFSSTIYQEISPDSTVLITSKQLKETNLIFIEHKKLLEDNNLLNIQLNNYKLSNSTLVKTDSLRLIQLNNYKELSNVYDLRFSELNKELIRKNRTIRGLKIGGVTVSVSLLFLLIFKWTYLKLRRTNLELDLNFLIENVNHVKDTHALLR